MELFGISSKHMNNLSITQQDSHTSSIVVSEAQLEQIKHIIITNKSLDCIALLAITFIQITKEKSILNHFDNSFHPLLEPLKYDFQI